MLALFASALLSAPVRGGTRGWGTPGQLERTVILVAIDGVRWQEVFNGVDPALATAQRLPPDRVVAAGALVPNLTRLATSDGAAAGAPGVGAFIAASGPNFVSLPGYMEMLTGQRDPGCRDNYCSRTRHPTIAEEVAVQQRDPLTAAVIASWQGIDRAAARDPRSVTVSAGRTTGATRYRLNVTEQAGLLMAEAELAKPWPGHGDFRRDTHTAELSLAYLKARRPRFLFVGLGETDEFGHANDYAGYLDALKRADAFIGRVWEFVQSENANGRKATLLVTTDHGRARGFTSHGAESPESARVFLIAAGSGSAARGPVALSSPRRLADVNATARHLLGLPAGSRPGRGAPLTELMRAADADDAGERSAALSRADVAAQ